ncbi:ATP-binding protein [Roseibium sp.]|uniref:PAS domain-containing sensor histidine kinase n=1 Tax=Roseibium sp. TaxID=1936156 RepID=UPI003D137D11
MDKKIQSFLELTATNDLVQLVADKRAAWLWSADGARILWANAAGASFFSARSPDDLARLTTLERSPARPHIARIAEAGPTDRFSIDRLRFYRGLRVMLLTCQCKCVELENGEKAALIICGDQGLALTRDPVTGFAQMLTGKEDTVFLTFDGRVTERLGALEGTPEDLDLPEDQTALIGPLELEGRFHEGVVFQLPDECKLIVLENAPLADTFETGNESPAMPIAAEGTDADESEPDATEQAPIAASDVTPTGEAEEVPALAEEAGDDGNAEVAGSGVLADEEEPETGSADATEGAGEMSATAGLDGPTDEIAVSEAPAAEETGSETPGGASASGDGAMQGADEATAEPAAAETRPSPTPPTEPKEKGEDSEAGAEEPERTEEETGTGFVFQPRRRPVRFAWKMDINQRFTFLSDEFADVLGPEATDIVGLTWEEVSDRYDLDPRGQIARALDRRDTWSGKTVDWPVTGAPLRVPVDMAALPAFDRNRRFEGYRGFGVCRTADAIEIEESLLSPALAAFDETFASTPQTEDPAESSEREDAAETQTTEDAPEPSAPEEGRDAGTDAGLTEQETLVEEDTGASRGDEAEVPPEDGDAVAAETDQPAETEPQPARAKETIEDLKPAQPNSFAGKTFLGASAAALVGSLSKFTGKPVPATESKVAASAKPELAKPETSTPATSENGEGEPAGSALDAKLKALETGTAPAEESSARKSEDPAEELTEADAPARLSDDASQEPDTATAGPDTEGEPETEPVPPQTEAAAPEDTQEEEPTGISGPAALMPAEIESAVKSLAKSYKATEKLSRDLFEDSQPRENETASGSGHETDGETRQDDVTGALLKREPKQTFEPETAETETEEDTAVAEEATVPDGQETEDNSEDVTPSTEDDGLSADEREFFQETAAYEGEDQAAAAPAGGAQTEGTKTERPTTGEVIPLATVKPRVVPVDTSGLSRPERQAFRKIAEALGARLEGDLEDFDAPDTADEVIEELPPEVPEAGPIDPSLLDRLPIGIAIAHDREVLYANKALLAMLGYRSIKALSEAGGLEALFIDDTEELPDAEGMEDEVDEAMKLRLADGGVLNVDAHMHSVPWNDSRGLMISITERPAKPAPGAAAPASPNFFAEVRGELESARSQIAEMDTILETATDGVLVLDQKGTILKANGSAEALFSANRSDMIGAPLSDFLAQESHRAAADYLDGLTRNGVASILNDGREVLGKVPSGGLIPLFMTIGRINGNAEDTKYCAVLRDITQWKTAEEELTQAKRQAENASSQKSDFLAKISHEIRTPLNAIIGFSEVMMEERFGPIGNDRYKDYLKDIRTSGSHIMSLINDLLDLSKIEAGKLDLKFTAVSTNDVINECVALMQPQANRERIIIRASLPESVPNVVADQRSLRQIVLNLLSNAIKYNKSGGQVILSTALESNGEVALRVRDTGTGMTAKQLAAALEPFRQLHTATRGGGTGLGLPLTKALVEANRASFHIDSTPDQGTLVEIIFPTQRVLSE